jgi:hypothetical protein
MKRHKFFSPAAMLSVFFVSVMIMIACGKEGAQGPEGPAGPAGPGGAGNIIYSTWLDVPFKPDTVHRSGGRIDTVGWYSTIDAPKLTAALVSTADVKAYINARETADPLIYPLPYNGANGLYIELSAYATKLDLYSNGNMSTFTSNGKKYQQYRYMIVPGNITARSADPVNWSDYAEVKAYLGLKD